MTETVTDRSPEAESQLFGNPFIAIIIQFGGKPQNVTQKHVTDRIDDIKY